MPPSDPIYDLQERLEAAECAYTGSREKNRQLAKRLADTEAQLEKAETEANEGFVEAYEKGARYGRLAGAERQLEAMEEAMKKLKQVEKQRDEWEGKYWDLHNGVGGLLGSQQSIEAGGSAMKLEMMNTAPRKSAPAALSSNRNNINKRRIVQSDTDTESSPEGSDYAQSTGNYKKGESKRWHDIAKRQNHSIILSSFNKARREAYDMRGRTPPDDLPQCPWDTRLHAQNFREGVRKQM
ncbi:hypothetical protein L198_02129 [Cryptococcus wingfieldii CBS 7118]|uniref:Uncharacterized protein n=1 Tax=Cryptococcus wingfieldii CBS 7118 TaxID=1295528 RepID=A0A1E3JXF1_9TREE|nr:hypothetical protein L198_02129 [Cryptococcus wingfieldii CBS 7118]ODO05436.1 hypothetical protein L198_02129 [Cryptococcus wingfieldii CBS 7118]